MTIHSSTLKKAERNGLTVNEDLHGKVVVVSSKPSFEFTGTTDTAQSLISGSIAARVAMTEYGLVFAQQKNGKFTAHSKDETSLAKGDDLETVVSEALDALFDTDAEEAEADEDTSKGSVVPEKYKLIYAERGDPTNCGDWLAITFNRLTHIGEGTKEKSDPDRVLRVAEANGINDAEKYTRVKNIGWEGRLRMTVRNRLVKIVATAGVLFDPFDDKELKAPKEWMVTNANRAAKAEPATTARKPAKATRAKTTRKAA